jgi:hypothetical protein
MQFAGMNYFAVIIAAIAGWFFGWAWYHVLADPWLKASGKTRETFRQERAAVAGTPAAYLPFVISFIAELLMAWVLAGVIGHLGPGQVTVRNGIISGAFIWLGFVLTSIAVNYTFGGRTRLLIAIDAGHWLAVLVLMGAIIGFFGA